MLRRLKSILLLAGAFTFAFLLGETVHELGHYLGHRALGHTGIAVYLDPYGDSHIGGVTALPLRAMGITAAAGPLLNLALAVIASASVWRYRRPRLLPLQLWGPVALVQEGVTFSLGILTPGGDAAWIAASGVPLALVPATGVCLLLAGVCGTSWLVSRAVSRGEDPFWAKLLVVGAGFSLLMGVRAAHALTAGPAQATENLVPFAFVLILSVVVAILSRPFAARQNQRSAPQPAVSWRAAAWTMTLGIAAFVAQILV